MNTLKDTPNKNIIMCKNMNYPSFNLISTHYYGSCNMYLLSVKRRNKCLNLIFENRINLKI